MNQHLKTYILFVFNTKSISITIHVFALKPSSSYNRIQSLSRVHDYRIFFLHILLFGEMNDFWVMKGLMNLIIFNFFLTSKDVITPHFI